MVQAKVQYMWDEQKAVAWHSRGCQWGCWGSVSCSPTIPETWLWCGYSKTALPSSKVRAPETRGALPSNVTNTMWHVSARSRTSPPFTHKVVPVFVISISFSGTKTPTQTGTDTHIQKNVAFSISLSRSQTQDYKDTQTEMHSYSPSHEHTYHSTHPVADKAATLPCTV